MHLNMLCYNAKTFKCYKSQIDNELNINLQVFFDLQVGAKDTLNSIALKFNITPNQVVQLNRLYSHSVVPGQVSQHNTTQDKTRVIAAHRSCSDIIHSRLSDSIYSSTEIVCS